MKALHGRITICQHFCPHLDFADLRANICRNTTSELAFIECCNPASDIHRGSQLSLLSQEVFLSSGCAGRFGVGGQSTYVGEIIASTGFEWLLSLPVVALAVVLTSFLR